jgi:hypothetical protein
MLWVHQYGYLRDLCCQDNSKVDAKENKTQIKIDFWDKDTQVT